MTVIIAAAPTPAPSRSDTVNFSARADAYHAWLPPAVVQMNLQNAENNTLNANVNAKSAAADASATSAATMASAAAASLNFRGAWSSLTGALNVPSTVAHLGRTWMLLNNLANVTTSVPGTDTANWLAVSTPARPSVKPGVSVDWTLKPTAAALTAAGWTIARAGEMTSLGLPTKAAENLFTQSQNYLDDAWNKTEVSITTVVDESGLAGVSVVGSAINTNHVLRWDCTSTNVGGASYRVRFLCKSGVYTKVVISDRDTGRAAAQFDLATGVTIGAGFGPGYVSHSITAHELGGGLYWCELVMTSGAAGTIWTPGIVGYPDTGATVSVSGASYLGDSVSGVEVFAAQLQQGFDGEYIQTDSTPLTRFEPGLVTAPANELAYQHNAAGECVGLVQYPADTNLMINSQDLSNASWQKTGVAVQPSKRRWAGSVPFWRVTKIDSVTSRYILRNVVTSVLAGSTYSATVAFMADRWSNTTSVSIGLSSAANTQWGAAADSSAVVVSGPGVVTRSNGALYNLTGLSATEPTLLRITRTYPLVDTTVGVWIYPGSSGSAVVGSGVLATRVHLSASPRLMPYIPTTSAAVTRGAQTITLSGSAFAAAVNPAQGALLCSASVEDSVFDEARDAMNTAWGASANFRHAIGTSAATSSVLGLTVRATSTQASAAPGAVFGLTPVAAAYSFAANNFQASANGSVSALDTEGSLPSVNQINHGTWAGLIQRTEVYPRAMSAAELQAITTPGVLQ